jgi:hypothetical protein
LERGSKFAFPTVMAALPAAMRRIVRSQLLFGWQYRQFRSPNAVSLGGLDTFAYAYNQVELPISRVFVN